MTTILRALTRPARTISRCLATGYFGAVALLLFTQQSSAQDLYWDRQMHAYLDGVQMAVYHGGTEFTKPVFADLDGDGDGDLYVGEHDGYLNAFENLGGNPPNWACISTAYDTIDVGKQNAPTFWDIDADEDLDLFIGDEDGQIWYYRNDGTSTSPSFTYVTQNYNFILVTHHAIPFFEDLDADGDDDLLIGHDKDPPILGGAAHYLNAGSVGAPAWSFQTTLYESLYVGDKSTVCVFDVDDDTLPDIFMSAVDGRIKYFHNEGPPTQPGYSDSGIVYDVGFNGAPTFCDIDGDDDLDLISGKSDGNLTLLTNTGLPRSPSWEFTHDQLAFLDAGHYSNPALVDIDGDSDLDLFIGRIPVGIMFLENIGTPDSAAWSLVSAHYEEINLPGQETPVFADLDADGDYDMVLGSTNGKLAYYQNDGTPQAPVWADPDTNYTGVDVGDYSSPDIADVDADGDLDIFIGSSSGSIRWVRNDGDSTAAVWQDLGDLNDLDTLSYASPCFFDVDGDADLDLLIGHGDLTGTLYLFRNEGSPMLPDWVLDPANAPYHGWDFGDYATPCTGDLDGDGDEDLMIGCVAGGLYLMRNHGTVVDVIMSLYPSPPVIVVPVEGDTIQYLLQAISGEAQTLEVIFWTMLALPGNQVIGPLDSLVLTLDPGTLNQNMTLSIPGAYPAGDYELRGYLGQYPVPIYTEDSFAFSKEDTVTAVNPENNPRNIDLSFRLNGPYPNPYNHRTRLAFTIPAAGWVDVSLFNVKGRRAAILLNAWRTPGEHHLDVTTENLAAGIYFIRVSAGNSVGIRKVCYIP